MIDIKRLEQNKEFPGKSLPYQQAYKTDLEARKSDPAAVAQLLDLNDRRKKTVTEFETERAKQNKVGQEIAALKRAKKDASQLLEEMQQLSAGLKEKEKQVQELEAEINELLLRLPNHLHATVPHGESEEDNRVERTVGSATEKSFVAKEHWEIGESLGIIDFERAGKVTGARFAFLKKGGARLERALIQFMMDMHARDDKYEEMIPPFIVNSGALVGTGQFPKFRDDVFHLEGFDYHLVPTAEVPVTNYYREEILAEEDLPKNFVAYTPCFRSEAGSYGKDTKGLIRQHQFNKVELLKFVHPEKSYEEHERLTADAESVLQQLELPYRVVTLCSADIGFAAAKCYDIEVWLPGQKKYREISSCSNFEDFQARRANIRFRPSGGGKPQFVHTLNGSGLAVGRTLIAILENYQNEDGSVTIPKALESYMGGTKKLL